MISPRTEPPITDLKYGFFIFVFQEVNNETKNKIYP